MIHKIIYLMKNTDCKTALLNYNIDIPSPSPGIYIWYLTPETIITFSPLWGGKHKKRKKSFLVQKLPVCPPPPLFWTTWRYISCVKGKKGPKTILV